MVGIWKNVKNFQNSLFPTPAIRYERWNKKFLLRLLVLSSSSLFLSSSSSSPFPLHDSKKKDGTCTNRTVRIDFDKFVRERPANACSSVVTSPLGSFRYDSFRLRRSPIRFSFRVLVVVACGAVDAFSTFLSERVRLLNCRRYASTEIIYWRKLLLIVRQGRRSSRVICKNFRQQEKSRWRTTTTRISANVDANKNYVRSLYVFVLYWFVIL